MSHGDAPRKLVHLDPSLRLPVASIAFPALRGRPEAETRLVTTVLGELINADGQIDIFEYCLGTLVFVGLNEALTSGSPWKSRRQSLAERPKRHLLPHRGAGADR